MSPADPPSPLPVALLAHCAELAPQLVPVPATLEKVAVPALALQ